MKVRNSKSDASIENGQSVLAVIIYTSDGVIASITDALTDVIGTYCSCHYTSSRSRHRLPYIPAACDAHKWINQLSSVAR